jgi:WD40 repeat protein
MDFELPDVSRNVVWFQKLRQVALADAQIRDSVKEAFLWDPKKVPMDYLLERQGNLFSVAYSPDGNWIATGSDAYINIYDVQTRELEHVINPNYSRARCVWGIGAGRERLDGDAAHNGPFPPIALDEGQ